MQKSALIINAGGTDNLGDKAIRLTMVRLLESRGYVGHFLNFATPREDSMDGASHGSVDPGAGAASGCLRRALRKYKRRVLAFLPPWLKWLKRDGLPLIRRFRALPYRDLQVVFLGGGQLILAYRDFKLFAYAFFMWYWLIRLCCRCPIVVFAVGVGETFSGLERFLYTYALRRCHSVCVRDHESIDMLRRQFGVEADYVPDVAFCYSEFFPQNEAPVREAALVGPYDYDTYRRITADAMSRDEYMEFWADIVSRYRAIGHEVRLVYTVGRDKRFTREFSRYLREHRNCEVTVANTDTLGRLTDEFCRARVLCSARMHALILALEYGCHVEAVAISGKIRTFQRLYLNDAFDLEQVQANVKEVFDSVLARVQTRRDHETGYSKGPLRQAEDGSSDTGVSTR